MSSSLSTWLRSRAVLLGIASLVACTENDSSPRAPGATLGVGNSDAIGRYLTDATGRPVFTLLGSKDVNACLDDCAEEWPPVPGAEPPPASSEAAVQQQLIAAARRQDGRLQLTYSGHPLHYRRIDSGLQRTVADRWGQWSLLFPHGEPMTPP